MNRSDNTHSPAKENRWYQLATIGSNAQQHAHYWNGWLRHCLEQKKINQNNGQTIKVTGKYFLELRRWPCDALRGAINLPLLSENELADIQKTFEGEEIPDPVCINEINFQNTIFSEELHFDNFVFLSSVNFSGAIFHRQVHFQRASFIGAVHFQEAIFHELAYFFKAVFLNRCNLIDATLHKQVDFLEATFCGNFNFSSLTQPEGKNFIQHIDFDKAVFRGKVLFHHRQFMQQASFAKAQFLDSPPAFFEAKFLQEINFNNVALPPIPAEEEDAEEHSIIYRHLMSIMHQKNRPDLAFAFLLREKQCQRVVEGKGKASFLSRVYNAFYKVFMLIVSPHRSKDMM